MRLPICGAEELERACGKSSITADIERTEKSAVGRVQRGQLSVLLY